MKGTSPAIFKIRGFPIGIEGVQRWTLKLDSVEFSWPPSGAESRLEAQLLGRLSDLLIGSTDRIQRVV